MPAYSILHSQFYNESPMQTIKCELETVAK